MNHTRAQYLKYLKHLKYLTLKYLMGLLFYLMLTKSAMAFPVQIPLLGGEYPILDLALVTAIKNSKAAYSSMAKSAASAFAGHEIINNELSQAAIALNKINTQYRKNIDLTVAWNKDTDPNLVLLKSSLVPVMTQLRTLDANAKKTLDDYEEKFFFNDKADFNKGMRYGRRDPLLEGTIRKNSMCQSAPKRATNTYANLQESSCNIVHNTTAYKKALYDFTLEKQDLLKKAMKMIMNSSLVTIGEHDARKTMLLELEVLYQETTDDFKLRSNNADIQAHIARDTELYAAQTIGFGSNSSVASITMETEKALIGTAISVAAAKLTPYNK